MTTTFETAKVGDKVWSSASGWGTVKAIDDSEYPITVYYEDGASDTYTVEGFLFKDGGLQVLFWNEIVFDAPVKPMPDLEVDAKVFVWGRDGGEKKKRYFSHYGFNGSVICFNGGHTSWFGDKNLEEWANWEAVED